MKEKPIYLLAFYYMKPRDRVNTSKKGWMDNPENIRYDEKVEFCKGPLKAKQSQANIIVNLSTKTIERNSFKTDRSFDEIFRYFFDNYHQYLLPIMSQLDPEYLQKVSDSIKAEMEEMQAKQQTDDQAPVVDVKYEEVQAQ